MQKANENNEYQSWFTVQAIENLEKCSPHTATPQDVVLTARALGNRGTFATLLT